MSIWQHPVSVEDMNKRSQQTMAEYLSITFTEVGDDFVIARMPVDNRVRQPLGIMNGGASCVLAETTGSTAANYAVDQNKYYCVGLTINTNHIRAARSGFVIATAKPYHIGRSTHVWHIEIHDEAEKLISISRLTMAVMDRP